jgi:hypothetical protein
MYAGDYGYAFAGRSMIFCFACTLRLISVCPNYDLCWKSVLYIDDSSRSQRSLSALVDEGSLGHIC